MLRLHKTCFPSVSVCGDGKSAKIKYATPRSAVLSSRPIQPGENITFRVDKAAINEGDQIPAAIIGLTSHSPDSWFKGGGFYTMTETVAIHTHNGMRYEGGKSRRACAKWTRKFGKQCRLADGDTLTLKFTKERAMSINKNKTTISGVFANLPDGDLWVVVYAMVGQLSLAQPGNNILELPQAHIIIDTPEVLEAIGSIISKGHLLPEVCRTHLTPEKNLVMKAGSYFGALMCVIDNEDSKFNTILGSYRNSFSSRECTFICGKWFCGCSLLSSLVDTEERKIVAFEKTIKVLRFVFRIITPETCTAKDTKKRKHINDESDVSSKRPRLMPSCPPKLKSKIEVSTKLRPTEPGATGWVPRPDREKRATWTAKPTSNPLKAAAARADLKKVSICTAKPTPNPLKAAAAKATLKKVSMCAAKPTFNPLKAAAARADLKKVPMCAAKPTRNPLKAAAARADLKKVSMCAAKPTFNPLNAAAARADLKKVSIAKPTARLDTPSTFPKFNPTPIDCQYRRACQRYMKSLNIPAEYLNPQFNRCYCRHCMAKHNETGYYLRGSPPKVYAVPEGWVRFGFQIGPRAKRLDIFNKFHVAFHGTDSDKVHSILDCGDLLMPGDVAFGGKLLKPVDGHFTEKTKPQGFDIKQVFVSPTIRYAGRRVYAKPKRWFDSVTRKNFDAKVVLGLRIRPGSYAVGPQTVLRDRHKYLQIDPEFSNAELEWSTKERGATIPVCLLVKLQKPL